MDPPPFTRSLAGAPLGSVKETDLQTWRFNNAANADSSVLAIRSNLPYVVLYNSDTAIHTFTAQVRAAPDVAPVTIPVAVTPNAFVTLPVTTFGSLKDQNPNNTCYAFYSDVEVGVGVSNPIASPLPVTTSPLNVDFQFVKTVDIAAAQAEEVLQAGANNVPDGALIRYDLSMASATAADDATVAYIALKGETSGKYIVMCSLGNSTSGSIRKFTGSSEKIDVVAANAGAVGHSAGGSWGAETGA